MFFLTLKARRRVPAVKHAGADDFFHQCFLQHADSVKQERAIEKGYTVFEVRHTHEERGDLSNRRDFEFHCCLGSNNFRGRPSNAEDFKSC